MKEKVKYITVAFKGFNWYEWSMLAIFIGSSLFWLIVGEYRFAWMMLLAGVWVHISSRYRQALDVSLDALNHAHTTIRSQNRVMELLKELEK